MARVALFGVNDEAKTPRKYWCARPENTIVPRVPPPPSPPPPRATAGKDAIHAGIFNDLGSGSNVDITIVPLKGPANIMRGYDTPNEQADLRGALVDSPGEQAVGRRPRAPG